MNDIGIILPKKSAALNIPENLENSAVATGLEKGNLYSKIFFLLINCINLTIHTHTHTHTHTQS